MTPTGWSGTREHITFSTSTILTVGAGATCTGATRQAPTWCTGRKLPIALYPRQFADWCFSGSAVVDTQNTSGFQQGAKPPLVASFTSTGRGECIVYSNDRGADLDRVHRATPWSSTQGETLGSSGMSPGSTGSWPSTTRRAAARHRLSHLARPQALDLSKTRSTASSNARTFSSCPSRETLRRTRWVLYAADGKYMLGDFDGRAFHSTSGKDKLQVWYGNFYAAQSFSNTLDRRRIQIGWANGDAFPGMPFNQQMTLPVQLALRKADGGVRLFAEPVDELASLRGAKQEGD